ncbi:MAG: tetratricopeptide repeat protein [Terrimicrobiaceae bacterium]
MKAFALFLLLAIPCAQAVDLRRPPAPEDIDAVLAAGFSDSSATLATALAAAYKPGSMGVPGSSGNPAFTSWLTLWRWCELLSRSGSGEAAELLKRHLFLAPQSNHLTFYGPGVESDLKPISHDKALELAASSGARDNVFSKLLPAWGPAPIENISGAVPPDLLKEWMKDDRFSRMLFETLSTEDYAPLVLANLRDLRTAHPAKWMEYQALVIALAVVNDSRPPDFWPHRQVKEELFPREQLPVAEQFAAWVAANEQGGTLLDLRKMTPGQLKFVVDAFVTQDELAWARKNIRLPRLGFEKAFSMVRYRSDRLKAQKYSWEEEPYLLQTIRSQGGICVDQAYFAMLCGKARGLPTLYFTGQGADGGHAWFGYMKSDDRWELDCGRYETQNYSIGRALDPQTWRTISDHELLLLSASYRDKPEFLASVNDLTMAGILERAGNPALAGKALESAVRTSPRNHDAWIAQGDFLATSGASVGERKTFQETALKQFSGNPDIKTSHQQALAAIAREQGDSVTADKLERLIFLQNRRKRSDLSVDVVARQMQVLLDAGKLDEATKEFRRQLNSLAQTGGGNFFYGVASPYILALLDGGKNSDAMRAVEMARKKLAPEKSGILDSELNALEETAKQAATKP